MSTQNSLNESILNWDDDTISKNVDYVLSKVRECVLSENEQVILDHVMFALEKLLPHIPVDEAEGLILKDVCSAASEMFQSTIDGIEGMHDLAVLSQTQMNRSEACVHLLDLCCHILAALLQSCQHFLGHESIQFHSLENYLKCLESVAKRGTQHYQKRKTSDKELSLAIEEFWKKLTELQSHYYILVTTKIHFDCTREEQIAALEEVFLSITAVAVESFEFDVVFMASTWKSFLAFVEKYQDRGVRSGEMAKVISNLAGKIGNDLDALLECQRNGKDMANMLKVDNFLLKILVKLCRIFQETVGKALDQLLDLILLLFRSTPTFLRASGKSQEEINEISKKLPVGADPLLSAVYTEPAFLRTSKKKMEQSCDRNPYGCLMLLMSLWKKLTSVKQKEAFFSGDFNILDLIFSNFEACHFQIVSGTVFAPGSVTQQNYPDLYEFLLPSLTSVILTFSGDEFEKVEDSLLRSVLQPYPWRAMLACDLWVLLARCGDSSLCNATIEALIPVFELIDCNTPRPEFIYLSSLLRRLAPLADVQFMLKISERYPPKQHIKIWGAIGLRHFKPESQHPEVVQSCLSVVRDWTRSDSPNVDLHNRMLESLTAISSIPTQHTELKKLWDYHPDVQNPRLLDSYLYAVAAVTSASVAVLPENALADILEIICEILSRDLPSSQKMSILQVLSKLSSVSRSNRRLLEYTVTAFKSILKSESIIIRNIGYRYFTELSFSPVYMEHIGKTVSGDPKLKQNFSNFLMKILPNRELKQPTGKITFNHRCYEVVINSSDGNVQAKRIKLDEGADSRSAVVQEALTRLGQDFSVIMENYSVLNEEQRNGIRALHKNFTNFLNTI